MASSRFSPSRARPAPLGRVSSLRYLTGQGGAGFLGGAAGYFIAQTAQAVIGAVGQGVQGAQMIGNPQAYLPQLQSFDNPHDVRSDPYLQAKVQQQGQFDLALSPLKFLENIPLVGAFTKLAEDATGLSQAIQNQQLAITQSIESHMRLVAANDQYSQQILQLGGNAPAAAASQAGLNLNKSLNVALKAREAGDPTEGFDWYSYRLAERAEIGRLDREKAVFNAEALGMNTVDQAGQSSAIGSRLRLQRNEPRALLFDQQAERMLLEKERLQAMAQYEGDPFHQDLVDRQFRGETMKMDGRQELARADLDRSIAIGMVNARASGEAAQAASSFDPFGARRAETRAARFAAMRMARSDAERATYANSFDRQDEATDFDEYRTVSDANDVSQARGAGAFLESHLYRGEAGRLARFVGGMQAANRLPPEAREAARHAVQQEDAGARVGIHRFLANETASLILRRNSADLAFQFNDDPTVGSVSSQLGRMRLELDNADPRVAGRVQSTLMAEERELRHQMLGLHSGGFALRVGPQDVGGDPIEQARQDKERRAMGKLFDEFEGSVGKFKAKDPVQQQEDLNKNLGELIPTLKLLADKLMPWALAR